MSDKFNIKNIDCKNKSILIIKKNLYYIDNVDKLSSFKNKTYNFSTKYLKNINKNLFKYKKNNIELYLLFSSKYSDSALFFNIIIKENNKYLLLKFNYKSYKKNIKVEKKNLNIKNINTLEFIKEKKYIFYFSYKNINPCKIKLKNKNYLINYYIQLPIIRNDIEKKNVSYCKLNNDKIAPIKNEILNCNYLKLKNNKKNDKLKKCSLINDKYLIKKIPSINKILKDIIDKKIIISAGKIEENIEKNQKEIDDRISNKEVNSMTKELQHTLSDSYKLILSETVNDFSSYLKDNNINKKTDDIDNLTNSYINILKEIKERNNEYKLIKKFNICKDNPIKKYCPVKNVLSCQKLCNNLDECRFISYSNKNKKCNLYDKCSLKRNNNYETYIKSSLLRDQGYNWVNRLLLSKYPKIKKRPFYIDVILMFFSVCFIISLTSIVARFIIIFIKLIYCFIYNDTCYYPYEIFSNNDPVNKYI